MGDPIAVRLREVVPDDLPMHFAQQRDPESTRIAAVAPRDRPAFDAHWRTILEDPSVVVRTVLADGTPVGSVLSFLRDGRRHVGYWIAREHWGRGIATAALGALLDEVRERPLFATVAAGNHGSRRVLERCGFRPVGEERQEAVLLVVLRLD
jgi:RimJ/RimL family protein N-acetyltransferase